MNIQTLHSHHAPWSCAYAWIYLNLPVFKLSVCTQRFSLIDNHGVQYCNGYFREGGGFCENVGKAEKKMCVYCPPTDPNFWPWP